MVNQNKKAKVFDGRYAIDSIIGRGQCSVVYKVVGITPPHQVSALKVLVNRNNQLQSNPLEKLRKEALAMVSARHKHVIRLDDFHSVNDICYLCMEYAPEKDLRTYTEKHGGRLEINQAEEFLKQSLEALTFIHDVGIIHRDIKPDNLLVINDSLVKLGDFGISVLPGESTSIEELKAGLGSMDYMPPEVFQGTFCNYRSDIYSLGVTFYEIISGIQPFSNIPLSQVIEIRKDSVIKPLSELGLGIPDYISNLIYRAMSFNADNRFTSAREMLQQLTSKEVILINTDNTISHNTAQNNNLSEPEIENEIYSDPYSSFTESPDFNIPTPPADNQQNSKEEEIEDEEYHKSNLNIDNDFPTVDELSAQDSVFHKAEHDNMSNRSLYDSSLYEFVSSNDSSSLKSDDYQQRKSTSNFYQYKQKTSEDASSSTLYSNYSEDNFANAQLNIFNKFRKHSENTNSKYNINNLIKLLIIITILIILTFLGFKLLSVDHKKHSLENVILPYVKNGVNITFPELAHGTYVGNVDGFFKKNKLPLSFISQNDNITVIIGIDGWQPASAIIKKTPEGKGYFNLKANGCLIKLFPEEITDERMTGKFSNQLTGESGTWEVLALKK